jgi:DNA-binding MarR family transcriptional regulator
LSFSLTSSVLAEVTPQIRTLALELKEFFLLANLDEHPNPADLARVLIVPKPTVTFLVKRMEAAGYVRREVQPGDLRRFRLTLTAAGRKAMEKAREILDATFEKRVKRLTQAQRAELHRLLASLTAQ